MTPPDLFRHVHRGLRAALFAACHGLGAAAGDLERERQARALLAEALRFVAHHGENEDLLLLPLLEPRVPEVAARMASAHAELDRARGALDEPLDLAALYSDACAFTAAYLAHLDEEERTLEPKIRAALAPHEIADFGRRSVERTAPADQRTMLAWMLPAMPRHDAEMFLARLPPALAADLRALVGAAG